ncbi:unnamed protein product [Sphagnum jensenii]|uniref:Protein kinase domain-containing protein n=1 Tax=Sphagnum jensenii TaxID=128206 RepID=A0ABP1B8D8_9BRYO
MMGCIMTAFLFFFFFLIASLTLEAPMRTDALSPDGEALLSFKRLLQDPGGQLSNWNENDLDPCNWSGIRCQNATRRVFGLNVPFCRLQGSISPELGKLDKLHRLDLHKNEFFGQIPPEIGNCSSLKSLYLEGNYLTGDIPEELGNLSQLMALDLANNGLTGTIPTSLGSLHNLTFLNVSSNFLVGEIPTTGVFANSSFTSFEGNPGLCGPQIKVACKFAQPTSAPTPAYGPSSGLSPIISPGWTIMSSTQKQHHIYSSTLVFIVLTTLASALLLALVCSWGWFFYQKCCTQGDGNKLRAKADDLPGKIDVTNGQAEAKLVVFHGDLPYTSTAILKGLEKLGEKDVIGSGGYGTVYRLIMDDGVSFAVKRIAVCGSSSDRAFEGELEILGYFKHRNLVNLRGFCNSPLAKLLIYDYLPNGNLDEKLHELEVHEVPLNWQARIRIAIGTARGLAYLHHDCCPRIIHRDIKSSNILLDQNLEPHVSDFGLAKLLEENASHVTTIVAGTFGYLAPEYLQNGRATDKGDVYSYGVVLLELLSGKRPSDTTLVTKGLNLAQWAHQCVAESKQSDLFDPKCSQGVPKEQLESVLQVACMCINPVFDERPTMDKVVQLLEADTISPSPSELSNFFRSPMSDDGARDR